MAKAKKNASVEAAETTKAVKKTAAPKKADEIFVQFAGKEFNVPEIVATAKAAFKEFAPYGQKAVKSCQVYVKPEENAAYYVINDDFTGKIEL